MNRRLCSVNKKHQVGFSKEGKGQHYMIVYQCSEHGVVIQFWNE